MRIMLLAVALVAFACPANAKDKAPKTVEVDLASFSFAPSQVHLKAGAPVVLHLVNTAKGGHNFSSPKLFAAAAKVSGPVENGTVEVPGNGAVDVGLTPARGIYPLSCTHVLHATFGMTGEVDVE